MKKYLMNILFIHLLIVIATQFVTMQHLSFAQYTEGAKCKRANIQIQGAEINSVSPSFVLSGEIMVPVIEFLDKIGVRSTWNSNANQLIVYDNNIFLKLMQNDFYIQINGQRQKMNVPAVLFKGSLYAPARYLLNALEIEYKISRHTLDIKYRETSGDVMLIDRIPYRQYTLIQEGFHFYVPVDFTYSGDLFTNNENETIRVIAEAEWDYNAEPTDVVINGYNKHISGNRLFYENSEFKHVIVFENVLERIADQVIKTVSRDVLLPNTRLEHYYEFADFHNLGAKIASGIYSNVIKEDYLNFVGSIQTEGRFKIKVQKDLEKYEYYIPIENEAFIGKVYLPFGSGKHNISISLLSDNQPEKDILIFSAINSSDAVLRDIVPTVYMDYENAETKNTILKVKYAAKNQKQSAELIYKWILNHFILSKDLNTTRKLSEIVLSSKDADRLEINEQETCILYAGMLRSTGVPAKIARKKGTKHYWVEAYLNGEWKQMGIVTDLKNRSFSYFYKKLNEENQEYLEY